MSIKQIKIKFLRKIQNSFITSQIAQRNGNVVLKTNILCWRVFKCYILARLAQLLIVFHRNHNVCDISCGARFKIYRTLLLKL